MANQVLVYIGTYTRRGSEGIYVYGFDPTSGALEYVSKATGIVNPSFLAIESQRRYLYSVTEVAKVDGKPGGAVAAYAIDAATGELTHLNQQLSCGKGPCHLSVDQTGRFVLVANYGSGSVAMLPIQDDGRLGEATSSIQHEGSSVNPKRQRGPHAHSITVGPSNRFAFAADLGLDQVLIYEMVLGESRLKPGEPAFAKITPGAGPRHFDFHPSGRYAYLINELDNTMTAFAHDAASGALTEIQTILTLPDGFDEVSYCADVHVAPSGNFLYGSNRGHDSIVIFAIDDQTGKLTLVGHEPTLGRNPRNFAIDPTGTFLLAANQDTDNIVTFRIDRQTGKLSPTGHVANVPMPVCLKMVTFQR